ncbi:unnamed protein product, partial [Effrenium voratum]
DRNKLVHALNGNVAAARGSRRQGFALARRYFARLGSPRLRERPRAWLGPERAAGSGAWAVSRKAADRNRAAHCLNGNTVICADRAFFEALLPEADGAAAAPAGEAARGRCPDHMERLGSKSLTAIMRRCAADISEGALGVMEAFWGASAAERSAALGAAGVYVFDLDAEVDADGAGAKPKPKGRKRQRVCGPLGEDQGAITLQRCQDCRLSRELGCPIYVYDWGARQKKPVRLRRAAAGALAALALSGTGRADFPAALEAVAEKDGHMYYADACADRQRGALGRMLSGGACPNIQDAHARVPLLVTPSETAPLPPGISVVVVPDDENSRKKKVTDGQAEAGPPVFEALRLRRGGRFCAAQFRAVLPAQDRGAVLAKGMLEVNARLGPVILLRQSKARRARRTGQGRGLEHGVDVVQTSERAYKEPRLGCQLAAALLARANLQPTAAGRAESLAAFNMLLASGRRCRGERLVREAWALGEADAWSRKRTPVAGITLRFHEGDIPDPTPVAELTQVEQEPRPWTLSHGTRHALKAGGQRLKSKQEARGEAFLEKPELPLDGETFSGLAVGDTSGELESGQCYVFKGQEFLTGTFVVWRFPVLLPSDIGLWEAKEPPPGMRRPGGDGGGHPNTIVVNKEEDTIVERSGGDLDGDGLQLSNDPDLVAFVRNTPGGEERISPSLARVEACLEKRSTSFEGLEAYLKYLGDVPSFSVKAMVTVMAERALGAACSCDSAAKSKALLCAMTLLNFVVLRPGEFDSVRLGLMDLAFDMGHFARAATDAPKKWDAQE